VLRQGIQGISDLISMPSLINLDFADVRTTMKEKGLAHMGIGRASGDNRAVEAAKQAISSPLLETTIEGAKAVLINITGDPTLGLMEIEEAASMVAKAVDPNANIIFGAGIDDGLQDVVRITVIATGFEGGRPVLRKPNKPPFDDERMEMPQPRMQQRDLNVPGQQTGVFRTSGARQAYSGEDTSNYPPQRDRNDARGYDRGDQRGYDRDQRGYDRNDRGYGPDDTRERNYQQESGRRQDTGSIPRPKPNVVIEDDDLDVPPFLRRRR